MKWEEAVSRLREKDEFCTLSRAVLLLRPTGRVATQEQYDYVLDYARHTGIYAGHIRKAADQWDTYLHIRTDIHGASPMFYFSGEPEGYGEFDISKGYEHYYSAFSYGMLGRIEFEQGRRRNHVWGN